MLGGLIGVNIRSLGVDVKKPIVGKVKIEHKPIIEEIKATKVVAAFNNNKIPAIEVKFKAEVEYVDENDDKKIYAVMHMTGNLLYGVKDEKASKELEKKWKENGSLDGEEINILNTIMRKSVPKFMMLADMFSLPPVIQIPKFVKKR